MSGTIPAQLGDYELREMLHETEDTQTFVAQQRSIDRTVALVLLKPHRCADPSAVAAFREDIKAKARVTHPRIAAVYEASEQNGLVFYTREMVAGEDIESLRASGHRLSLEVIFKLLKTLCDTFLYYEENQLGYRPFQPEALVVIHEEPYLANLATAEPSDPDVFAQSLAVIRVSFWSLLRTEDSHVEEVRQFFARMDPEHLRVYRNWEELKRACSIAGQVALTAPRWGLTAQAAAASPGEAAVRLQESSLAAAQSMSRLMISLVVLLLVAAAAVGWWWWESSRPLPAVSNPMVRIAAGSFVFQEDQEMELPEFWISKYEVTIAQYAEFLAAAQGSTAFDHADQPETKQGHVPAEWTEIHTAAQERRLYLGQPLTINCPVVGVDWWDAYAYARWRGGRLPKAEEWEKAARGVKGYRFPWGPDPDPARANTGLDYDQVAGVGGFTDGFNSWAPVDQLGGDVSPFGIVGMGGNVSEWTGTLEGEAGTSELEALVKGASFVTEDHLELTHGRLLSPNSRSMSRGFRIAADRVR